MFIPCHQKAEQNHMMIFNEHRLRMYEKKDGEIKDVKDDVKKGRLEGTPWGNFIICSLTNIIT